MPENTTPSSRAGLVSTLLGPIQTLIQTVLTERGDSALAGRGKGRTALVAAIDGLLVRQFPLARLVPPEARRRLIRRQLDVVIDDVLLNKALPAESVGSGFESFILSIDPAAGEPAAAAEKAVRAVLGADWIVAPLALDAQSFAATTPTREFSVQEAWTLAYRLRAQPGIRHAEPNIIVPLENLPAGDALPSQAKSLFGGGKHLPGSAPHEWSLTVIQARKAWQKAEADGRPSRGEDVLIGHPDTGYTRHPENWANDPAQRRLLPEYGWDFWKKDSDPTDDLVSGIGGIFSAGMIGNPGHGTGTSSVIFSGEGGLAAGPAEFVTGVAPRARLIPFRVAPSVVVWDQRRLADAIKASTDAGCHVISISMGGLPLDYLQKAVIDAVERGVIVCSAAGNLFGANDVLHAVVWPAAYSEVLAVAASNAVNAPWKGSSRGPQVDITAPGESVWHAIARKDKPLRDVARGSGTSFAVATTAGVAALWLAYHGRDALIAKYGRRRLASVFRQIVVTHGFVRPAAWKTGLFGAGILDALKVLSAPLPAATAAAVKSLVKQPHFDQLASLFDDVPRAALRRGLAQLLKTPEPQLPARLAEVGDELVFHLFSDSSARQDFRAQLIGDKPAPKSGAKKAAKSSTLTGPTALTAVASPQLAAHLRPTAPHP
jgi:hypothetical protein